MKFSNPRLSMCIQLALKETDLRTRRVKLLQLLELIDKANTQIEKPSAALREDRAQVVRLLNQTNEFLASREAL